MSRLKGWTPAFLNPATILWGVKVCKYGPRDSSATSWIEILFPGLSWCQVLKLCFIAALNGPKTDTSSGWIRWEQCGGKVSSVIPFALQNWTTWKSKWLLWLSNRSSTLFVRDAFVNFAKCFKLSKKVSALIHPDGWANPRQPGGPCRVIAGWNLTLGRMNDDIFSSFPFFYSSVAQLQQSNKKWSWELVNSSVPISSFLLFYFLFIYEPSNWSLTAVILWNHARHKSTPRARRHG